MDLKAKVEREFPPSKEIETKIKMNRAFFVQRLDPDHGFLDEFTASDPEIIQIKYQKNPIQRSEKILEYILKNNRCKEFFQALYSSKQAHLANFILGNGEYEKEYEGDWPLSDQQIRILDANHKQLIDNIDPESGLLLDRLFSNNILNMRQKESINAIATRHRKVEVLLEMLRRCSLNEYRMTIQCLHESNQSHVAKILEQGRDGMVDEVLKEIQKGLKQVDACLTEGDSRRKKLKDGTTNLLAMVENTEGAITRRANELKQLIDMHLKYSLENLSVFKKEKLKKLENEDQENNEILTSFENLKTDFNQLKCMKSSDDINQSAKEAHGRADDLKKLQKILLQRQIPSIMVSFKSFYIEEFGNIFGKIEVQSESPPVMEKKAIVLGLFCDNDGTLTNEMIEFNLNRPNEISYLESVPTEIPPHSVAVTYDDKLFSIGIGGNCNEIWKFERNSGWKKCANLNQGRIGHCANIVDNSVYICGGWHDYKLLKSVEAFDIHTNKCSTVGGLVYAVRLSACAAYKGLIYIFGGQREGNTSTDYIQIYNTRDNTCSLFSKPMPSPQSHLRALAWNNSVILLNGETCFIFDFETENWRERKQFKTHVIFYGLVLDDEKVFVFGGEMMESDAHGNVFTDEVKCVRLVDIINDNKVEWKQLGRLPKPTEVHSYT